MKTRTIIILTDGRVLRTPAVAFVLRQRLAKVGYVYFNSGDNITQAIKWGFPAGRIPGDIILYLMEED